MRQLTTDGGGVARWSPDGKHIAYVRAGSGDFVTWQEEPDLSLRVIDSEGGEPRILVQGGNGVPFPRFPEWSLDGRTVYYKAVDPDGTASFWSVPVLGGAPTLLVRFDDPSRQSSRVEFTTDGRRFYFTMGRHHSDIWVAELKSER